MASQAAISNEASKKHSQLNREQRAAYFAWQSCPLGNEGAAFMAYVAASKALESFNKIRSA